MACLIILEFLRFSNETQHFTNGWNKYSIVYDHRQIFFLKDFNFIPLMKERDQVRMETFRKNLRKLREDREWKQHDLASRCDVHRSKISALETNAEENLNLTTLFELAKGLGVHPKELIDYPFDFLTEDKKF